MRKALFLPAAAAVLGAAACAPRINIDFLGTPALAEVVLVPSPAAEKVAVLDVDGTIASVAASGLSREGDILSKIFVRLEKAAADPLVKAVILRLDTPGGEVTASDIIYHEILKFKERTRRPVVGLMMSLAASGGYYIAQACDLVLAHPSTITGSIGVISVFPSLERLFDKVGFRMEVVKSGEMKDAGSPFRSMTEEERRSFQTINDEFHERFLEVVLKGRQGKLTPEALRPLADGRIFTARQALEAKLIDGLGYFEAALEEARALAGLRAAKVVAYTYYPKSKTNLYAGVMGTLPPLDVKGLDGLLPSLKTGFYYLWLPEVWKERP
ncbi:MAG: signal peptide peptidase SppA [Candidatus Aminicenantes bacterium]|nr:signal peptide peptidase SppA [Candidatus Aminicenantes bacterium]